MSAPKLDKDKLLKLQMSEEFIALQAHLLRSVMEWMDVRSQDPTPLTTQEQEMGSTAMTIRDELLRMVNAS